MKLIIGDRGYRFDKSWLFDMMTTEKFMIETIDLNYVRIFIR